MPRTVLIAGLGFMGGSLALALRAVGWQVRLWHHRAGVADEAAAAGLGEAAALDGAWDVAVACAPVGVLPGLCAQLSALGPLTTDVGSTKGTLCAALTNEAMHGRFVGSHPMCGSHLQGWRHAQADLYRGATTVVCPHAPAPLSSAPSVAAQSVRELWTALGCRVVDMAPELHDRAVANASHLPHICAALAAAGLDRASAPLAASGFRDTTRVAAGCPDLWADILLANRQDVSSAIAAARTRLDELLRALATEDRSAVLAWLVTAQAGRKIYSDPPPSV